MRHCLLTAEPSVFKFAMNKEIIQYVLKTVKINMNLRDNTAQFKIENIIKKHCIVTIQTY